MSACVPRGDDVNYSDGRDESLVCGWCRSARKVDLSRPRRCAPCRADEEIVRVAGARLAAAGQPPLGSKAVGTSYVKIRRQGDQARARLAERRRTSPAPRRAAPPAPPVPGRVRPVGRRLTATQKGAGAARLQAKVETMQKELAAMQPTDRRGDRVREDLAAARRLLSDWADGVN